MTVVPFLATVRRRWENAMSWNEEAWIHRRAGTAARKGG